jgi:hypothetical protein
MRRGCREEANRGDVMASLGSDAAQSCAFWITEHHFLNITSGQKTESLQDHKT